MKKLILLATSLATLASAFAQVEYDTIAPQPGQNPLLDQAIESAADMYRRMDYRRDLGGHKLNKNFVFQNTLLKLFRGALDSDSLISTQPQLSLVVVNESVTRPVYTQNAVNFFKKPEFVKYNTSDYIFTHNVSKSTEGYYRETIVISEAMTRRKLRGVIIQYEAYSNQIRLIIDNCYEHLN